MADPLEERSVARSFVPSPVILNVGLIAGLCFLRGLGPSASSLVLAERFLFVVGTEEDEGLPAPPISEVGLAPSQGLVKGLIS